MKGTLLILSLILVTLCPLAGNAQTIPARYWSDAWRGWHFYEDPEPDGEDRHAPPPKTASPAPKPKALRPPELVEFERLQKALEETRNIAIMRPTEANPTFSLFSG